MMKLTIKRYDEYKDSEVELIGEMPDDWGVKRVEDVSNVIDPQPDHRAPALAEGDGYPYIGIRDLNRGGSLNFETARKVELSAVEKQERSFTVISGDILFCKVGTLGEPRIIVPNGRFALSATLVLIKTKNKTSNVFLKYALESSYIVAQINYFGSGSTRPALGIKQIRKLLFTNPSFPEQRAIANYLNTKTAQIDRKIDLLTQKADKYGELKQSLINETVTRGLDKTAVMKDSGVEWVGEVPEHWKLSAVTNITSIVSIKNHPEEELLSVYRDYGVIIKNTRDDNHNKAGQDLSTYKLVEPGFLVINKMKTWQGSLGMSEYRGIVSPAYITCKTDRKVVERSYLHHLLRCRNYINEYNRLSYGVRVDQWDMRYDDFKYVPVLLPPMEEQKAIADYLDTKTEQIDRIIETINTQIEKLKELRKTLINDVVTGRIKVYQEGEAV